MVPYSFSRERNRVWESKHLWARLVAQGIPTGLVVGGQVHRGLWQVLEDSPERQDQDAGKPYPQTSWKRQESEERGLWDEL